MEGFVDEPLEAIVEALCAHLGLDPDDLALAPIPALADKPNGCAPTVPDSS